MIDAASIAESVVSGIIGSTLGGSIVWWAFRFKIGEIIDGKQESLNKDVKEIKEGYANREDKAAIWGRIDEFKKIYLSKEVFEIDKKYQNEKIEEINKKLNMIYEAIIELKRN